MGEAGEPIQLTFKGATSQIVSPPSELIMGEGNAMRKNWPATLVRLTFQVGHFQFVNKLRQKTTTTPK